MVAAASLLCALGANSFSAGQEAIRFRHRNIRVQGRGAAAAP